MNPWLIGSAALLVAMVPAGAVCLRGSVANRLVGLETATITTALLLVTLSLAFHRAILLDLAVATALLGFGGGLVFARFLERWL